MTPVIPAVAASPVGAHGVGSPSFGPGAQLMEFYYASGEAMGYAAVRPGSVE